MSLGESTRGSAAYRALNFELLVAEGGEGVDARGAASREIAGGKRDGDDGGSADSEGARIGGRDTVEKRGQRSRECVCGSCAEDDSHNHRISRSERDHFLDARGRGSQSHANADFALAAGRVVRNEGIGADKHEYERETGKRRKQPTEKTDARG